MSHWLRKTHPDSELASTIAFKIESVDDQIAALKEQILHLMGQRAGLEDDARNLASDAEDESEIARTVGRSNEAQLLAGCRSSVSILHNDLRRLYVESSPFLSELAQQEMEKAQAIHESVTRWQSCV